MIKINGEALKKQRNFWNQCVFHPTDAVEDAWGGRILDRMSADGAINAVRVYAMLEDVVYKGENGELLYDFRINDLRLDYLISRGFDLVIAFAAVPDCISRNDSGRTTAAKGKTRYKGKMWNTNPPADYALWEEVCYEYTRHLVERYGEKTVSGWHFHCFNEPDIKMFFLTEIPSMNYEPRCEEYLSMYEGFVRGVRRASSGVRVGGPALAATEDFLRYFLNGIKQRKIELDYISMHFYGTDPEFLNSGAQTLSVDWMMKRIDSKIAVIKECGFENTPIVIDEWGASSCGFYNVEECKALMFREHEIYSAYFVRFLDRLFSLGLPVEGLMICLSGQHEMTEDFTGFRNFFTLNFIAKPIYNAFILASRLGETLLYASKDNDDVTVIPTKTEKGDYAVLLSYSSKDFETDIPSVSETVSFSENVSDKTVTVWCIDRNTTNPYRAWERAGAPKMCEALLKDLREEGKIKPVRVQKGSEPIELSMTPNSTYLITVTD